MNADHLCDESGFPLDTNCRHEFEYGIGGVMLDTYPPIRPGRCKKCHCPAEDGWNGIVFYDKEKRLT